MLPIWKRLGWLQKVMFQDHYAKTMTGLVAFGLLMLAMIFWPKELKMKVDGVMHPTTRQTIFSQTDGIVKEILIKERALVTEEQPLLRLENKDLELQISNAESELSVMDEQMNEARARLSSSATDPREKNDIGMSLRQFESEKISLRKQLDLWREKEAYQVVTSPIDGTVITSRLNRRFNEFPVEPNYPLLEVADLAGNWQLELKIPQAKIGYIDQAFRETDDDTLDVEFKIGSNPNLNLKGILLRPDVEMRAVQSEATGEPVIRAIVTIPTEQLDELKDELRSGVGATVKVLCGKHSLGFVCFYQVYDYLRTKLLF